MSSELTFGLYNNTLIHISEANNGESCNCTCPHCGAKLIARQGDKNSWCFAHKNKEDCSYGQESALHHFAKDVLAKKLMLKVPSPSLGKITFDSVALENRLNDIIPDVILSKGTPPNDNHLLVEIKVTHGVDDKKLSKIKEAQLSAIEIDLSPIDFENFDRPFVENMIINDINNKVWLYNKKFKDLKSITEIKKQTIVGHDQYNPIKLEKSSGENSKITLRKPNYKKMETSLLLAKYKSIENGEVIFKEAFDKYQDKNTVISYVQENGKLKPEPNLCKKNDCNSCSNFISEYDLYEFIDNTCYMAIKCNDARMKINNIIEFLMKKLEDEQKTADKSIRIITNEDVTWSNHEELNYEIIKILYDYIYQSVPYYSNNILSVKDKFDRFKPVPNLCSNQRCGKWCKNFLAIHQVKIKYFFNDAYVYVCKCTHHNVTKTNIDDFIRNKIRMFRHKRYWSKQNDIRKKQQEEGRQLKEFLENYIKK